jgi:hypothetical protein
VTRGFVAAAVLLASACSGSGGTAPPPRDKEPYGSSTGAIEVVKEGLCVTKGNAAIGTKITEPTVRAVVRGTAGDAAELTFVFHGDSDTVRELANGKPRRQLGLKLRAENGCNLLYVMWRLDPKPEIEVSIKHNPGMRTHKDCGAGGYTKVKPTSHEPPPDLELGAKHVLRAQIAGDELSAWIDDKLVWRGTLPESARELRGPAGMRSDNLAYDLVAFGAPAGDKNQPMPKCVAEEGD